MSKRLNGEGSITQRADGRYMVRVTDPASGKRRAAYFASEDEAKRALRRMATRAEEGRVVLAKGAGALAGRIRLLAGRHAVPIVCSPALARELYAECEIDGMVPPDRYLQLAPVYRSLWAACEESAT